jgi:hypothetical protein
MAPTAKPFRLLSRLDRNCRQPVFYFDFAQHSAFEKKENAFLKSLNHIKENESHRYFLN